MIRPMFTMGDVSDAVLAGVRSIGPWDDTPFPHGSADGFLPAEIADALRDEILEGSVDWYSYKNPLEIKRTANNWNQLPPTVYQVLTALGLPAVTAELQEAMGLSGLIPDLGLHGGGIHWVGRGGKLNVHQDYSLHPKSGLQRRANLILYLNPHWQEGWGGSLQLWSNSEGPDGSGPCELVRTIAPVYNRAVVFRTDPGSWHGFPDPLQCPEDEARISLAFYYCSTPQSEAPSRWRAKYAASEEQREDEEVRRLIELRSSLDSAQSVYRT